MTNKPADPDRRVNPRAWMNRPGRISVDGSDQSYAQVIDISSHGVALFCSRELAIGTHVEVQLSLKMAPETVQLKLRGQVDRSELRGESHRVRVRFVDPTMQDATRIDQFVRYRTTKTQ